MPDLAAAEINKRYEEIERQRHRKRAQESDWPRSNKIKHNDTHNVDNF